MNAWTKDELRRIAETDIAFQNLPALLVGNAVTPFACFIIMRPRSARARALWSS